jgi:hypothetical protein
LPVSCNSAMTEWFHCLAADPDVCGGSHCTTQQELSRSLCVQ